MDIKPGLPGLLDFLDILKKNRVHHYLLNTSPDDVLVCFASPGVRIEVRFQQDQVDFATFHGHEDIRDDFDALEEYIVDK